MGERKGRNEATGVTTDGTEENRKKEDEEEMRKGVRERKERVD